jgi:hypothetical protein
VQLAETPRTVRLVAVTDALDFALRPRMDGDRCVVVPLPAERAHLVNVEVGVLVTRRDSDEIMIQQTQRFNGDTRGAALRFYLPALPPGDYVAAVRSTSTIMTEHGAEEQDPDRAQVSLRIEPTTSSIPDNVPLAHGSERVAGAPRARELAYHFRVQHRPHDEPALVPDESEMRPASDLRLQTTLRNNEVVKVTLDCWASSDGEPKVNMAVSLARCRWISKLVRRSLGRRPRAAGAWPPTIIEASHGEDNPPVPEPAGAPKAQLAEIQAQNRVVIVKIYTTD